MNQSFREFASLRAFGTRHVSKIINALIFAFVL